VGVVTVVRQTRPRLRLDRLADPTQVEVRPAAQADPTQVEVVEVVADPTQVEV